MSARYLTLMMTAAITLQPMAAFAGDENLQDGDFDADRAAILAMAGDYVVSFDFQETVSLAEGYELKERYQTGGHEIVRVIEDQGDFISLQHILVVGGGEARMPVKHWRQDWQYEPSSVLTYVGGNTWSRVPVDPAEADGKWSQVVYQVDDAPRYGAVAAWEHAAGVSEWTPPSAWRPLPRRDAVTRDDYHAVDAVNRHVITPQGWVHEQDNTKLALDDGPRALVREIGVNTYTRDSDWPTEVGDSYWNETSAYWQGVRAKWSALEGSHAVFGLTVSGEPEAVYTPILELADQVRAGEIGVDAAIVEAEAVIDRFTTPAPKPLDERLASLDVTG